MAPRWLCECERTVADDLLACWSCGRPRPTTADDVVARLTAEVATLIAERDEARGLLRDVDTAWSDCLLTEDQADVLERIAAHLGRTE